MNVRPLSDDIPSISLSADSASLMRSGVSSRRKRFQFSPKANRSSSVSLWLLSTSGLSGAIITFGRSHRVVQRRVHVRDPIDAELCHDTSPGFLPDPLAFFDRHPKV